MKIGIDVGGSHIAIGVVNESGKIVEKEEKRLTSVEKIDIKKSIEEYIIENSKRLIEKYNIEAIGISFPGKNENGNIISSGNLGMVNYPIVDILQKAINLPITIKNDAKAAALAENKYGCLKGYDNSIFLTLGTGIGGAAFSKNELLKGSKSDGYEFGHMVIQKNGIPCQCGGNGCFEKYASMKAFKMNLRNALNLDEKTAGEELFKIIKNNNKNNKEYIKIENVINEYIENLSIGIINLINIFDPKIIGIGGSFVHFQEILLPILEEKVDKDIIIKGALLGNDAGIIGATL